MNIISASILITETVPSMHGDPPWRAVPTPLLLRALHSDKSSLDNVLAYQGRDGRAYEISMKLLCDGIAKASCQFIYSTTLKNGTLDLNLIDLNDEGDDCYSATWLNVRMPGSGLCRVLARMKAG